MNWMTDMFGHKKYNILVLGSNGMLGYDVYKKLIAASLYKQSNIGTVIALDRNDNKKCIVDLTERHALGNYMVNSIHFDYCINCTAYTDTKSAETTKEGKMLSYKMNALAPKYIAESCKYHKTKLIHISTDYVFSEFSPSCAWCNNNSPEPFTVDAEPFPVNNYGMHKLLGEIGIREVFGKKSKDYAILRTSWLYGNHNHKSFVHRFLKNVIEALKKDPNATITMTENEASVPTSTAYVVKCIRDVIDSKKHGTFHAVPTFELTKRGVSRYEFASMILKFFDTATKGTYAINGKELSDVFIQPVTSTTSHQPEYSVMKNENGYKTLIGPKEFWKQDLEDFICEYGDAIFNAYKNNAL